MRAFILTGRLDELRVGVVCDERDREIPEVQLQRARDDVDVFVHVHRNICLLTISVKSHLDIFNYLADGPLVLICELQLY